MKKVEDKMLKNFWPICLFLVCASASSYAWSQPSKEVRVDDLLSSKVGEFPHSWKTYPFHSGKAKSVYSVRSENGRRYIQAIDKDEISVPIFKDIYWDLEKYPYLKYRWRAKILPEGAKEVSWKTNDSACAVYVGFGRTSALKYVWSTEFSVGSYWPKEPGKFYIISREMGAKNLGKWQEVTIEVKKDYQKYFRKPLNRKPSGFAIMTDGNAVKKPSACDYADFRISTIP
jgi:hypothetical protein